MPPTAHAPPSRPVPLRSLLARLAVCLSLLPLPALAQAVLTRVELPLPDRYLVTLKPEVARLHGEVGWQPAVADIAREFDVIEGITVRKTYRSALRGFAMDATPAALKRLLADPRVAQVEPDALVWVNAMQYKPARSWGQDRIDQREQALDGRYAFYRTGSGVRVYVIDSGINAAHREFAGRIGPGYEVVGDGWGTADCNGHGTHIAGIIGGSEAGVAPDVVLHPVRVFGCGDSRAVSDVIAGIDWVAVHHQKPAVANLSFNGPSNASLDAAVTALIASGVSTVISAGNHGLSDVCYFSPSRVRTAVTVGATDPLDRVTGYSNRGACVTVYAPGDNIIAAAHDDATAFADKSGTSMAAAHVAGIVALHLQDEPAATPADVQTWVRLSHTIAATSPSFGGGVGGLAYSQGDDLPRIVDFADREKIRMILIQRQVVVPEGVHENIEIPLPQGWVAVGGGAEGIREPNGQLITASYPNPQRNSWVISTREHLAPAPAKIRGWVIGLAVGHLTPAQLRQQLAYVQATSLPGQHPEVTAYLPSGFVLLGGGFRTDTRGPGMLATGSWPVFPATGPRVPGWAASAKDHVEISSGTVESFAIGIREFIPGVGRMESIVQTSESDIAAHPEVSQISTYPTLFTGCGAKAHWRGAGSLLWRIKPIPSPVRTAEAGCLASAKDHLISDPSSVQVWSIGLRAY